MGGAVFEQMRLPGNPAVLTVAGHAVEIEAAGQPTSPEVRDLSPAPSDDDLVGRVARVEASEVDDAAALTGARVVGGSRTRCGQCRRLR